MYPTNRLLVKIKTDMYLIELRLSVGRYQLSLGLSTGITSQYQPSELLLR